MSFIYLLTLIGVAVAVCAVFWEAVSSVSRQAEWQKPASSRLALVPAVERRTQQLPFVGSDRRRADGSAGEVEDDATRRFG